MRTVFFARAQVAVPLAVSLRAGLLMGGLPDEFLKEQFENFKDDPDGILVVTNSEAMRWTTTQEAAVFFLEDSYVQNKSMAAMMVREPSFKCPTPDDFRNWYYGNVAAQRGDYITVPELEATKFLGYKDTDDE